MENWFFSPLPERLQTIKHIFCFVVINIFFCASIKLRAAEGLSLFNSIYHEVRKMKIKIMISYLKSILAIYASTLLVGCGITLSSSKHDFSDGYYFSKLNGKQIKKYYVTSSSDSIKVYPADIAKQNADTIKSILVLFPPHTQPLNFRQYKFRTLGLDLDAISIILKYRPA